MNVPLWFTFPPLTHPRRHLITDGVMTLCGLPTKDWIREPAIPQRDTDLCHWCVSYMVGKVAP